MLKKTVFGLLILILFYSRFIGLDWGLPYPMHPDERNMAVAVQNLNCEISNFKFQISNCLNPHFFAYGQFPLYLAYGIVGIMKFFDGDLGTPIGFQEATMALRIISAIASILTVFVLMLILKLSISNFQLSKKYQLNKSKMKTLIDNWSLKIGTLLILTFSPYFIQFSHFGTTENLLMFFYSLIIYFSLKLLFTNNYQPTTNNYLLALFSGLAITTKVSSIIFLAVPIVTILWMSFRRSEATEKSSVAYSNTLPSVAGFLTSESKVQNNILISIFKIGRFLLLTLITTVIFSPQTFISFPEFMSSIIYESSVAVGTYIPFYTRQFVSTTPILFQLMNIFPYALGWPQFILAILGFIFLSWKNKYINLLRFAFLIYFIPTAFTFAKWSRFMAPIFPLMSVFAILFLSQLLNYKYLKLIENFKFQILNSLLILLISIPGLAYLSIYQQPDVRFTASEWIYKNIPANSKILSETANVIDLPVQSPVASTKGRSTSGRNYQYVSFNFYDLDIIPSLQSELNQYIKEADYIFVPSRRIFMNHGCENLLSKRVSKFQGSQQRAVEGILSEASTGGKENETGLRFDCNEYPVLNNYYEKLFSGSLGFAKVAEFTSFPRICLFNVRCLTFDDERAEETWTVFDHPVIRIYKKTPSSYSQYPMTNVQTPIPNFQNYQIINYQLPTNNYQLLVADTPEKWKQGLMWVRSKEDINGLDGMIFTFPESSVKTFWNKNTLADLDVFWINDDKQIGISYLPSIEKSKQIVTVSSLEKVNKVVELIK